MPKNVANPPLRELIAWLTSITRPVHGPLFFSAALRIINLCLDIALFGLAGGGVMAIVTGGSERAPIFTALVVIAVVKALCYYLEQFSGHFVAFKALELLRTHAFSQLWPKAPAVVQHAKSGDILASLTRDVDRIEVFYAHTFAPMVAAVVVPAIMLPIGGVLAGWQVVIIPAICVLLALIVVPFAAMNSAFEATRHTLSTRRAMTHQITDSVYGVEEVLGYGQAEARFNDMAKLEEKIGQTSAHARRIAAARRASAVVLFLISISSIMIIGLNNGVQLTALAAVAAGALRLFEAPAGMENAMAYLDSSFASARRLFDICHAPEKVRDGAETFAPATAPRIAFDNVTYRYRSADGKALAPALSNVSIQAPAGKHTVFLGVSGSGKSTAAQLLLRYDNPDSGEITADGVPIENYTLDSLRSRIVLVTQRNQQINADIAANLRLGNPQASDDELWHALALVGMEEEVRAMPAALATRVGDQGGQISGGQNQRLCLARALLMKPSVLVLDEFTANLNNELEQQIRANIATHFPDLTIIEITHRLESVGRADHLVLLDRGKVVEAGSPDELIRREGSAIAELIARDVS